MVHYYALNYGFSAWIGEKFGNEENSTEDVNVPRKLDFFRDNTITTALIMVLIFTITFLFADLSLIDEISGGENVFVFAIMQAITFTAGFVIVLQGVRMMLAEIFPAFRGIYYKIVPKEFQA